MASLRAAALAISALLITASCGDDGGPPPPEEDGGTTEMDGGFDAGIRDPRTGQPFTGPIDLSDARVEAIDPTLLPRLSGACRPPVLARVTRVIDGDTVFVNGVSEAFDSRIRFIGVDTPELHLDTGADPDCYGEEARVFTSQLQSRLVWLTFDEECLDRFDRYLAYVWIGDKQQDLWERQLLRRGFASQLTIAPNDAFADTFGGDEASARSVPIGLWADCPAPP